MSRGTVGRRVLLLGSDDGVHAASGVRGDGPVETTRVLDAGQAMRVETIDDADGAFAATTTGLYHSSDGTEWTDLGVPEPGDAPPAARRRLAARRHGAGGHVHDSGTDALDDTASVVDVSPLTNRWFADGSDLVEPNVA